LKKKHAFECMRCETFRCLDLFWKPEHPMNAGNELYIYSILGEKIKENPDLTSYVCVNGSFLYASCFLTVPIFRDCKDSYLSEVLIQVTRDFKASMFLAFSGHYRQAMQVLRCAFENIISGVYFQSDLISLKAKKAKPEDFSRLQGRFNEWKNQGRVNIRKSMEILKRIGFLSTDEERDWNKLYKHLSRFIHTPKEFVTHVKHDELKLKRPIICPAATYFNEEQLIEWSDCSQSVFAILLKTIAEFHPEAFHTESGKLAVDKSIKPLMEEKYAEKIKVSKEIQEILSKVQKSD